ncbi:hypothetical protein [Sphingomonas sp.]|uniref:hypothetical protein n=1 Tax=Sphingomonas sp. TaxID=28214 RepID=UPI003F72287B
MNWNPFKTRKPAADDMAVVQADTVTLDYHKAVVEAQRETIASLTEASYESARVAEAEKARAIKSGRLASELLTERDAAHARLRKIAAMETPGSAPAAKRMARVAREGLPEYAAGEREAA